MYALSGHEFSSEYSVSLHFEIGILRKKNGEDLQSSIFSILFCQGCFTATARYGVTRKGSRKGCKEYSKADYKEPKEKKCLLTLDLKPFRSQIKEKHSAGKKFQSQPKERNC